MELRLELCCNRSCLSRYLVKEITCRRGRIQQLALVNTPQACPLALQPNLPINITTECLQIFTAETSF